MLMELGLKDKIAVITGSTRGIGLAVARGLAKEGAHIALCSRSKDDAVKTAEKIEKEFGVRTLGGQGLHVKMQGLEA